jgi:hypothetical protein
VQYTFAQVERVRGLRFVFDSDLNRPEKNQPSGYPLHPSPANVPVTMTRAFRVEAQDEGGDWTTIARVDDNHQRLVQIEVDVHAGAIRFFPETTWGADTIHVFAWEVTDQPT